MAAATAAQLTDEELFSELKRLGFSPGPVTESTRPVYIKKLKKLREEERTSGAHGVVANKTRNSNNTPGAGGDGGGGLGVRLGSSDLSSLSGVIGGGGIRARASPFGGGGGKVLLGFSSDESDVEASPRGQAGAAASRRERGSTSRREPRPAGASAASCLNHSALAESPARRKPNAWWGATARRATVTAGTREQMAGGRATCDEEDAQKEEAERRRERCKSRAVNGNRLLTSSSANMRDQYSDSEDEIAATQQGLKEESLIRHYVCRKNLCKSVSPFSARRGVAAGDGLLEAGQGQGSAVGSGFAGNVRAAGGSKTAERADRREDDEEEEEILSARGDGDYLDSNPLSPRYRGSSSKKANQLLLQPLLPDIDHSKITDPLSSSRKLANNHILPDAIGGYNTEPSIYSANSSLASGATSSSSTRINHSNHTSSNHTYLKNSYNPKLSEPEEDLLQQFKREEISTTGSFSAHYLSMFLLTAACLFFLVLGFTYLRMRGSGIAENMRIESKY